jgi:hypothetical protein
MLRLLWLGLLLGGCTRQPATPAEWTWPGANSRNTMFFAGTGTSRCGRPHFAHQWDAEVFDQPDYELPAAVAMESQGLVLADLDGDRRLEIVVGAAGRQPAVILSRDGLPRDTGGQGFGRFRVLLHDDSTRPPAASAADTLCSATTCWRVRLNGQSLQLRCLIVGANEPGGPAYGVAGCDSTGRERWRYLTAPRPVLAAAADLDGDGRSELLFGSYSEVHGWQANRTTDLDSTYCFCLDDSGRLVWQRSFGAWRFAGNRPCVQDLDGDGRPEVVVACHGWLNRDGGLYVLDAASGAVRARADRGRSFGSVGCADLERDGAVDIVAAYSGREAGLRVYRFEDDSLRLVRSAVTGRAVGEDDSRLCRLDALCDLDGDGRVEIVASQVWQQLVCPDPQFYPSRFTNFRLALFSPGLEPLQYLRLPARSMAVAAGDLIPGGDIELVVLSDRLSLYSTAITSGR